MKTLATSLISTLSHPIQSNMFVAKEQSTLQVFFFISTYVKMDPNYNTYPTFRSVVEVVHMYSKLD